MVINAKTHNWSWLHLQKEINKMSSRVFKILIAHEMILESYVTHFCS
jgi:hypothetical protein